MNTTALPLLFSLKPRYADLIFENLKRVELRRRFTSSMKNRDVFIYVSSPVRQLRGGFCVGEVWSGPPEKIWNEVAQLAQVDKRDFDAYYAGCEIAYALQITNVWEYKNPIDLDWLRKKFPNFTVPQSYRYVKPEEYRYFRDLPRHDAAVDRRAERVAHQVL